MPDHGVPQEPGEPCENCLRPDEDLVRVRRSYVVPETWEHPGSETTVDEVERWCASCRSTYPHRPADDEHRPATS